MSKQPPIVNPKIGYVVRNAVFKNEQQFAEDVRATVHKLADLLNTGREKNITVQFNINLAGDTRIFVPHVEVYRKLI